MKVNFEDVPFHYSCRTHEMMREVLLDPNTTGPAIYYYMIRGGVDQKNITVLEPGTVGGEYIKTYGHYHVGDLDENYWFIYGQGIALLQKLALDPNGQMIPDVVEEFRAVVVKPQDKVYMPAGYGHLVVNIGSTYFVTADDSPVSFHEDKDLSKPGHADYELVKKTRGFAYYVIETVNGPVLKRNPIFKEIKKEDLGGLSVVE